jgi:hypothetical protein
MGIADQGLGQYSSTRHALIRLIHWSRKRNWLLTKTVDKFVGKRAPADVTDRPLRKISRLRNIEAKKYQLKTVGYKVAANGMVIYRPGILSLPNCE